MVNLHLNDVFFVINFAEALLICPPRNCDIEIFILGIPRNTLRIPENFMKYLENSREFQEIP